MEGEQFSLCWNNFHVNLSSGFHDLLKDEDLVDVTLAVEGRYIKAHKTVLSVCSPYFKELFRVNPCKHPIVILQDVNYNALSSLLQFMYQGEVSVSQEEIPIFMKVAEILKIKGLTDNSNFNNAVDNRNGIDYSVPSQTPPQQPYVGLADRHPIMKRNKPYKKIVKPMQQYRPMGEPRTIPSPAAISSPPPILSSSTHAQPPPIKQPRLEENRPLPTEFMNMDIPLINPKEEPLDAPEDDYMKEENMYNKELDLSTMLDTSLGESSDSFNMSKIPADNTAPGTLQCILGKRGLPRLIVDGHTFYKKSTYKNKCFWYCKSNRTQYKCPAVCWTVAGRIVKWPEAHSHEMLPDVITPGEDTVVPIEKLRQVLIDASR